MRVIFLDIDGVMNHSATPGFVRNTMGAVDKKCLAELNRILEETGAEIVLSSMHRTVPEKVKILKEDCGMKLLDMTSQNYDVRARQIKAWLDAHPKCKKYAILDDLTDADTGDGCFFKTDIDGGGLTPKIADKIIKHFLS